jgi:hypothetical protein
MNCPYRKAEWSCRLERNNDALAYIQQLEAERDAIKDALGLMVYQYCVRGTTLDHHFMCAGETAFQVLGLEQCGDVKKLEDWLFPEPPKGKSPIGGNSDDFVHGNHG